MRGDDIKLTLLGHLWRIEPGQRRTLVLPFQEGKTTRELLLSLGIPEEEVMIILCNGQMVSPSYVPAPGDDLEVLPVINGG